MYLHSNGEFRCLHITRGAQFIAAGLVAALLIGGVALTLLIASGLSAVGRDRAPLAAGNQAIDRAAGKAATSRKSIEALARKLEARQDFMDDLYRTHFGHEGVAATEGLVGNPDDAPRAPGGHSLKTRISTAPEVAPLQKIDARQRRFAMLLTRAVERRSDKTAAAIRSFGLNPDALARTAARAQGGPFVPWHGQDDAMPGEFERLATALSRMEFLESSLMTIPSGRPTAAPMLSSSYGYRRDPFNGRAAFHAGLDFPGRHGQPILAAAAGLVSFVGQRTGYGNVVEIDHGNGIMTRYAHLSGFETRVGRRVSRGDRIARMGSTGRSTGDHLHFEVRLAGEPINPRRFLEARQDVAKIQQLAKARLAEVAGRS